MARIHRIASPENDSERKAISELSRLLPDHYQLYHNFEVTAGGGLPYEYDLAIATDHALWHVEVKGYHGKINGDAHRWVFQNGRSVPSPIALANKKTKILASELRRKIHGQKIWVDTVILLTDERARAQLRDPQAHRVIHIEDARSYFADPNNLPHRTQKIKHLHNDITEFFMGVTRPRKRIEVIGLYDVVERISQNEERTVFLGKHRYIKTRPETILKVFHFDMYSSERNQKQEIEEIFHDQNALRLLDAHPNIIDTADMFAWDDDKFVLPTEYVEMGRPLASLLADHEEENISWENKVDWIAKLCQALKHVHQSGIIHRDVSPVNVVVAPDGIVKLVNFDLARIPNTPHPDRGKKLIERFDQHYVAPEVYEDPTSATPASDIYSLGILFYELITGEPPYESIERSDDLPTISTQALLDELTDAHNADFMSAPQDAIDILLKMTNPDPSKRYQSMDEVMEDLAIVKIM